MNLPFLTKKSTTPSRKPPQDLVALDFGYSGIKAIRLKKVNGVPTVLAVDVLPAVRIDEQAAEGPRKPSHMELAKPMQANYAAVAYSGGRALVRVVSIPGQMSDHGETEQALREHIGLDKSYRVAYLPTSATRGKDARVLAVALPNSDAETVLSHVGLGAPAPHSMEISGLSAMHACLMGPAAQADSEAVCIIECGAQVSVMAIFNKGALVLARKLEVGGQLVVAHIQKQFGVDAEMAQSILTQGAFDISASIKHVIDPFVRQLTISRDFVERQENCRISGIFMSGGMCLSAGWVKEIERAAGMPVRMWDPFAGRTMAPGAYPEHLQGQQARFAAAMGSALGGMEAP